MAFVLAWFVFYALVLSALQEGHSQAVLYSQLREELAAQEQTAPLGGQITPDAPVALLDIPTAGVHNAVVIEGTAAGDLMRGPGHKRDTALPGQAGTSVIYGRAMFFGGPFRRIADALPGQAITVTTAEGKSSYVISDVRHAGDPLPQPLAAGGGRLTLATADGSGWRAGWAPTATVYVDANLVGKAFPTPPGRLSAVPIAESAMQGDPSALFLVVLWLPLLSIAALAAVWAQSHWGRWQAWVLGMPIVLAALWGVSEAAVQLLPNLT
jgi:sortase A